MLEHLPLHSLIFFKADMMTTTSISTLQDMLMVPAPAHRILALESTVINPSPPLLVYSFQAATAKTPKAPGFSLFI